MQFTPGEAAAHLREALAGYIESQYRISHPLVFGERAALLRTRGVTAQDPFIESTPAFAPARRLRELERDHPEIIPARLSELVEHGLHLKNNRKPPMKKYTPVWYSTVHVWDERRNLVSDAIYLDYAATTPVDPAVAKAMSQFLGVGGVFANPASRHAFGQEAERAVENARRNVANLISADPSEIIWTSGATESDNLAIKGVALSGGSGGKHIVTSSAEHKATLDTVRFLETLGFSAAYIQPDANGVISPERVESALRPDTALVSLMHVNNETGAITDVKSIADVARERGVPFHIDAAQSAARLQLDMRSVQADLVSLSGHKMYGPKGIGALYVRRRPNLKLQPQMHGGGHEMGIRSGTLPTHQIVGMGEAARLASRRMEDDNSKIAALSQRLLNKMMNAEGVSVNGNRAFCVPGIVNLRFDGVESESLMMALGDVAVSSGSACTSTSVEPSHVLMAMGLDEEAAHSSLRVSIGRFTTQEEVDYAAKRIIESARELRAIASL